MHTSTVNIDTSLAIEFKKHVLDPSRKNGAMDLVNYIKWSSQRKCTEDDYHVQDRKYVSQTSVKISCETTHFPTFSFYWMYMNPHEVRGTSKHYNI